MLRDLPDKVIQDFALQCTDVQARVQRIGRSAAQRKI